MTPTFEEFSNFAGHNVITSGICELKARFLLNEQVGYTFGDNSNK